MLSLGFLHPVLLWALLLAAVPIVIHLLNRRRFETVSWAAMEYLLAAMKRNRRRLRMEQWLVLLLRALAVVLLALLVARPQMTAGALVDVRTHHVVCLDDSASMSQRRGAVSLFTDGVARAAALTAGLTEAGGSDFLSVLRASDPARPIIAGANIGPSTDQEVRELLADVDVTDMASDLAGLITQARYRISQRPEASHSEIYLITDFRVADWLMDGGEPRPAVMKALMGLDPERERLTVMSVAPDDSDNLAVVRVRRGGRTASVGAPTQLIVEVKNQGPVASRSTEVAFQVDDKGRVLRVVEPLAPGESREVAFTHTFHAPGHHGVVASLPRDQYSVDDARAFALEVAESSRVLLVDGDPGERPEQAETYFLAAALEHRESGIEVEVIADHALAAHDLEGFDMVFMCNAPAPDRAAVKKLEEFVGGDGGGLVLFLGDQVDPARYNEVLFRGGEGLLPAELVDLAGDLDRPEHVYLADPERGAAGIASKDMEQVFAKLVRVGRYMRVREPAAELMRAPLRIGGPDGPPLLVSRTFAGSGEVMLVTSTADARWTNWPRWPTFLIVTQEMHRQAARKRDTGAENLGPGGVLQLPLDTNVYRPDVQVRALAEGSAARTFTGRASGEGSADAQRSVVEVPMRDLTGTGLFELQLAPHAGRPETRLFSRNAPAAEGRLATLTASALFRAYPDAARQRLVVVGAESADGVAAGGLGEIWRALALALLAVLVLESLLAWRFGRR